MEGCKEDGIQQQLDVEHALGTTKLQNCLCTRAYAGGHMESSSGRVFVCCCTPFS